MGWLEDSIARRAKQLEMEKAKNEVRIPVINGLTRRELKRTRIIHNRIAHLYKQIKNMPTQSLKGERREITALEWALKIIREHFDHINICEMGDGDDGT